MLRSDYLYKIPIIDDDIIVMGEREWVSWLSVCLPLWRLRGDFDPVQLWPGHRRTGNPAINNKLEQAG